jgi:hypothetical protein
MQQKKFRDACPQAYSGQTQGRQGVFRRENTCIFLFCMVKYTSESVIQKAYLLTKTSLGGVRDDLIFPSTKDSMVLAKAKVFTSYRLAFSVIHAPVCLQANASGVK